MPRFGCGDLVKWEVYPSKAASLFSVSGSGNSSALNLNSLFQEDLVTPQKTGAPPSVSASMCHRDPQVPPGEVSLAREDFRTDMY